MAGNAALSLLLAGMAVVQLMSGLLLCAAADGPDPSLTAPNVYHILSFDEYASASLSNFEKVVVLCGFFDEKKEVKVKELGELAALIYAGDSSVAPLNADNIVFIWTDSDEYNEQALSMGGEVLTDASGNPREKQNLKTLFVNDVSVFLFAPRTYADLGKPQGEVKEEVGDVMQKVMETAEELLAKGPIDPLMPSNDGEASRFLIDYGMLDKDAIESRWPSVKEHWCGGASTCEVEKRSNLTSQEFYEKYYLWGKPVIITDAMNNWDIEALSSFESISKITTKVAEQRKVSGASQLISVHDKDDQEAIRKLYELPYFFANMDPKGPNITLDTELFFFGEPGAKGLDSHLDTGCHQYWVPHFKGTKKWTFKPIDQQGEHPDPRWQLPSLTATINPGELLVFYSGWWHETEYPPDEETVSFTMYVHRPMPVFYLNEYRHELITRGEYKRCLDRWFDPDASPGRRLEAMRKRKATADQAKQTDKQEGECKAENGECAEEE